MNSITKFAVKYPVSVLMLTLAVCLLGTISYNKLGTDLFPDLKNPALYVEVKSGLTMNDYIAFPYGPDVKEGVRAVVEGTGEPPIPEEDSSTVSSVESGTEGDGTQTNETTDEVGVILG